MKVKLRVRVKTLCKLLSKLTSCWCCSRRRRRVEEDEVWAYPSFLPALVDDENDEDDESVVLIGEEEKEVEEVEEVEDAGAAEDGDVQEIEDIEDIEEIGEDREIAEEGVELEDAEIEEEEDEEIQPEVVVTADVVAEEIGEDFPERQTMSLGGLFSGPSIWGGAEEELNAQRWTGWDLSDLEDLVRAAGGSTGDVGSHQQHQHQHQHQQHHQQTEVSFDDNVDNCCEFDDYLDEIFDVVFQQQQQQPAFVEELSGDAADHVDDLDEDELMKMVPDLVHAISEAEAVITPTFAEEALTPIRTFSSIVGDGDGDLPNLSGLSDLSGVSFSDLSPLARMDVDDAIDYYDASQLQIVVDNAPLPPWRRCETFELTEEGWTRVPELPSFYNDLWLTGMGCDDTVQLNKDPVARRMFPKSAAAKAAAAKDDLNRVKEKYRRFNEIVFGDLPEVWEEDKWMPNIVCFSELSKLWDD